MTELIEAVKSRRLISCTYSGNKRTCEVYAIGIGANDEILVRVYDRFDDFKLFKYAKMKDIQLLDQKFYYSRAGYNPDGDKSMTEVLYNF